MLWPADELHCVCWYAVGGFHFHVQARWQTWHDLLPVEGKLRVRHVLVWLHCIRLRKPRVNIKPNTQVPTKPRKLKGVLLELNLPIRRKVDMIRGHLLWLQVLIQRLSRRQIMRRPVHHLACHHVHCLALPHHQYAHRLVPNLCLLQVYPLCVLPQVHALEVVVVGWRNALCAVFSVYFYPVEHLPTRLWLYYQSHLCEIPWLLQLQVVTLALLFCEHEFQLVAWVQVLNIFPLKFKIVLARSLAIHNHHDLRTFLQLTFRHKTRIHFFLLAHLEWRGLSTPIHEQVNIEKLAFLNGCQVKKEVLLFVLINLEHMEPLALI